LSDNRAIIHFRNIPLISVVHEKKRGLLIGGILALLFVECQMTNITQEQAKSCWANTQYFLYWRFN